MDLKQLIPLALGAFLALPARGADLVIQSFSGLNTEDTPAALEESESPDLLNVDIDAGGRSVKKREGYGLYKNLPVNTSTTPVRGGYHFQDSAGNDIQLWGNDWKINSIIGGATPVVIATMTLGSTLQCTDSQGYAYCFTSSRDTRIITDGTPGGTSYNSNIASGTMGAFTPTRLVVAGISGNANTLYFSRANTFNNFTIGTAEADAWTEPIASPGSRITHIRYACGKLLWWKDQSFGWLIGENQADVTVNIIQHDVGTLDNSSAYYNNTVWFRGQDNHIYQYDCANLTRLSRSISPTVELSNRRKANSWTQSSQAEFQTGISSSPYGVNILSVAGSVTTSSYSLTFSTGYPYNVKMEDSYSCPGYATCVSSWTSNGAAPSLESVTSATRLSGCGLVTLSPRSGSRFGCTQITSASNVYIHIVLADDPSVKLSTTTVWNYSLPSQVCDWTSATSSPDLSYVGLRVAYEIRQVYIGGSTITYRNNGIFRLGNNLANIYYATTDSTQDRICFDDLGVDYVTDTSTPSLAQTKYLNFQYSSFTLSGYTATFTLQGSSSVAGPWFTITQSSDTVAITTASYVRLYTNWADQNNDRYYPSIVGRSTGTYLSSVNNSPNVTSWDLFTVGDNPNNGTITYYTRASTASFTVRSSTPVWVSQPNGATVQPSTGTYFQMRADFAITAATQTPTLNDFTFNWFEGSALDKAYIEYFDDHVWVAVSSGSSTYNNRIQRWDTANQTWLLDDIPAGGLVVDQNKLYIGDPTSGRVFRFGDVYTDNASNITSYWKSKDFVGQDPFVQNEFIQHDWLINRSTDTLTITYQTDGATETSYTLNLFDSANTIIRRSRNLPSGKIGTFYNVKFGNTSDEPWEVFGHRVRYNALPWKPN